MTEHASLPVVTPSLEHLTNEELGAFRSKLMSTAKEARRKANQTIGRHAELKKPWQKTLSVGKSIPPEERAAVFREFEQALLRIPEAYIAHAFANSLILLEEACKNEMLRRSMLPGPGKKKGVYVPPPSPVVEELAPLDAIITD